MEIRGRRECRDCGREWSYYDTGSVACPDCGSLRSVGVDERTRHTAVPAELDLTPHRNALDLPGDSGGLGLSREELRALKTTLREYVRERGFIDAGELRPLDGTFLAAHELRGAVDVYARERRSPTGDEPPEAVTLYLLELLRGADAGERPPADEVPTAMRAARGLAAADAVRAYRRELLTWLDDHPDPDARLTLGTLGEHVKRVRALEGDVPLRESETLVTATRELSAYLRGDEGTALSRARDRLGRLEPGSG